jgi:hypothetical protein
MPNVQDHPHRRHTFSLDGITSAGLAGGTWQLTYRGDATNPRQDPFGDVCDTDSDNDSMNDVVEPSFKISDAIGANGMWCQSATYVPASHLVTTGVLDPDSDADGGLDGRECTFNSDPSLPLVKFPAAAAGTDPDGDLLSPRRAPRRSAMRTAITSLPGGVRPATRAGARTRRAAPVTSSTPHRSSSRRVPHGLVTQTGDDFTGNLQLSNVTCGVITAAAGTTSPWSHIGTCWGWWHGRRARLT